VESQNVGNSFRHSSFVSFYVTRSSFVFYVAHSRRAVSFLFRSESKKILSLICIVFFMRIFLCVRISALVYIPFRENFDSLLFTLSRVFVSLSMKL
jgi:hypothetical protein